MRAKAASTPPRPPQPVKQPAAQVKGGGNKPSMVIERKQAPVSFGSIVKGVARRSEVVSVSRLEYIGDVIGSTAAFSLQASYKVNPGQALTFPWLYRNAQNFDMYKFRRLKFIYMGKTSTANTGEVNLVFDPDPTDSAPASDAEALQYQARLSSPVWVDEACLDIPSSDLQRLPKFLVRESVVASELTTFDVGALHLIVGGNVAAVKVGQLWVDYEVDLYAPQIISTGFAPLKFSSQFTITAQQNLVSGAATTLNFSTAVFNPLGLTPVAGVFSGMSGGFSIYCQQTITCTPFTSGTISIRKNGTAIAIGVYGNSQPNQTTMNVFVLCQLVATDTIDVQVTITGTTPIAPASQPLSILIIAPA